MAQGRGAAAVIVPSRFNARVFRASGVRVPLAVVPEGVDPAVYPLVERPARRLVTTLVVGVLAERKNYRLAVEAWQRAFGGEPDARLVLKARFQLDRFTPDDPRITVVDEEEPTRGILHWYRRADVLLALGNEGFGLPVVEAMATGLPVVAYDRPWARDVVRHGETGLLVPTGDVEALAGAVRSLLDDEGRRRALGEAAAAEVRARFGLSSLVPSLLAALDAAVDGRRTLVAS